MENIQTNNADKAEMNAESRAKYDRLEAKYDGCFILERFKDTKETECSVYGDEVEVMALLSTAMLKSEYLHSLINKACAIADRVKKERIVKN